MYVQDIIVTKYMTNLGMSRKEAMQVILDIGQEKYFVQEDNNVYYLIREERLSDMNMHGWVVKYQSTTSERSHIFVSQQYRWHTMIEAQLENLKRMNLPHDFLLILIVTFSLIWTKSPSFAMGTS